MRRRGRGRSATMVLAAALAALGNSRGDVVALDGEVSNSTRAEDFKEAHPERFFEMYIAEQQMVAAAVGLQVRGWKPFASTFAAFFTRAYDFIRMAAVSRATLALSGSHAGVSIGEDGPSQMALEDLAMMRAQPNMTVLYPCEAVSTERLLEAAERADRAFHEPGGGVRVLNPNSKFPQQAWELLQFMNSAEAVKQELGGQARVTQREDVNAEVLADEHELEAEAIDPRTLRPLDLDTILESVES